MEEIGLVMEPKSTLPDKHINYILYDYLCLKFEEVKDKIPNPAIRNRIQETIDALDSRERHEHDGSDEYCYLKCGLEDVDPNYFSGYIIALQSMENFADVLDRAEQEANNGGRKEEEEAI